MPYNIDPSTSDCYPDSSVLINKLDVKDEAELAEIEVILVSAHAAQWEMSPSNTRFDFNHYKAIHAHLFGDIYNWAGQIRKIGLSKRNTRFCPPNDIQKLADRIFSRLISCNLYRGFRREKYIDEIVDLYCSINYLHPFREGNGRTQRLFLSQLVRTAGYELNFSDIDVDLLMIATIQSAQGVTDMLREILDTGIH